MGIKVRTISTLPQSRRFSGQDFVEMSKGVQTATGNGTYQSVKMEMGDFESQILNDTVLSTQIRFNMMDGNEAVDVLKVKQDVGRSLTGDVTLYGTKTFATTPMISLDPQNAEDYSDNAVTNVRSVRKLISMYGNHFSTQTWLERNPLNTLDDEGKTFDGSVYTEKDADNTFYYWHIDDGQRDSSYFGNEYGNNTVKMNASGTLNVYGWLADRGNALAQESWVGLFTKIYIETAKREQWVPISIVPWIQGKKSAVMQYVCFNGIGVAKGTELKIVSGFQVNGKNSGLMTGNSLLFKGFGYTANTFVGYLMRKD